jgi:ferredoxin
MGQIEAVGIKTFEAEPGKRLVLAIEDAGIDIVHRYGGNARCTTCRVEIHGDPGEMDPRERARLAREHELAPNVRLSCQILVRDDLSVRVISRLSETDLSDAGPRPTDELPPIE